jgi:hypothetical protein
MVMQLITEKKISDSKILRRIPDVSKYYLKKQFLLDLISNSYIVIKSTDIDRTYILVDLTRKYLKHVDTKD